MYQTSVAISPLIILRVSVKQSFKEWAEAGTHVLDSGRKWVSVNYFEFRSEACEW